MLITLLSIFQTISFKTLLSQHLSKSFSNLAKISKKLGKIELKLLCKGNSIITEVSPTNSFNYNRGQSYQKTPDLIIRGKSKIQEQTFYNDAARVWNAAPNNIKDCKTISTVKKHIKTFVRTLPV